jgi:hypothetical protein
MQVGYRMEGCMQVGYRTEGCILMDCKPVDCRMALVDYALELCSLAWVLRIGLLVVRIVA